MRSPRAFLSLLFVSVALAFVSCSDSTAPSSTSPSDGSAAFDGAYDPDGGAFLLQRIDEPIPGREPIHIELVGSNVQVDELQETVSVDVAIRNAGSRSLHAPATIWLHHFVPAEVQPLNADFTRDKVEQPKSADLFGSFGFDFSELLGEDGILAPGESSQTMTWLFHDPNLESFSFAANAEFGMEPDRPVISGMIFSDLNRNGIRDSNEGPFFAGGVTVEYPDGTIVHSGTDERGFYRVRVTEPGLHRVSFTSMLACVACYCETTPNPLEVILTPGPDGDPRSFEHADFGIYPGPCGDPWPPKPLRTVELTEVSPQEIDQDFYHLLWAKLEGDVFSVRVGYSGCSADHPFTLYAGRNFMESSPVQTWMLLAYDDLDELCDAYFEEILHFDLNPIQRAHIEDYGVPGIVRIRFRDFAGDETMFQLDPEMLRVTGVVTRIDDDVPVDGGVVIELQLDNGETTELFFDSMFTEPPPAQWRVELYEVIQRLEIGDHVLATGTRVPGGVSLRELAILER